MICRLTDINDVKDDIWYEYSLQIDANLVSIMLIKKQREYIAYNNSCPHQSRRMDYAAGQFLLTETGNIVCPAHGAEFNPNNGLCINGPCLGQSLKPVIIRINDESIFAIIKQS